MKLFAILLLACFLLTTIAPASVAAVTDLRPGVLRSSEVIIVTKPQFYLRRYVDREVGPGPHGGGIRDQRTETWLEFNYGGKKYSQLWSAKGWRGRETPAPVELDKDVAYRFLVRLEDEGRCVVLKVWHGTKLLWSR